MSGPQTPSPTHQPEPSPTDAHSNLPDPLLDSGSFIDPDRTDFGAEAPETQKCDEEEAPEVGFPPGVVIAAEPISVFIPGENSAEPAPRSSARRRNPEEMAKRPSWLPEDWKIDLRVRSSGASAGLIDRYYVEPTGQRKFRSKNEVFHFLETGGKLKRKPMPDGEAEQSPGSPTSEKQSKSSKKSETMPNSKRKESEGANSDKTPKSKGKKSKASPALNNNTVELD